jgi:hypothetical protein
MTLSQITTITQSPALKAKELYTEILENLENFRFFPEEYQTNLMEAIPYLSQYQTISLLDVVNSNLDTCKAEISGYKEAGDEIKWSFLDSDGQVDSDSIVSDELQTEYNKEEVLKLYFNSLLQNIKYQF